VGAHTPSGVLRGTLTRSERRPECMNQKRKEQLTITLTRSERRPECMNQKRKEQLTMNVKSQGKLNITMTSMTIRRRVEVLWKDEVQEKNDSGSMAMASLTLQRRADVLWKGEVQEKNDSGRRKEREIRSGKKRE